MDLHEFECAPVLRNARQFWEVHGFDHYNLVGTVQERCPIKADQLSSVPHSTTTRGRDHTSTLEEHPTGSDEEPLWRLAGQTVRRRSLLMYSIFYERNVPIRTRAGVLEQSMGARIRIGIGLSHRPARLHSISESMPWNKFLGSLKV